MTKEEKALYKFVNDPAYREKVVAKIHSEQTHQYEKRIKVLKSEKDRLISKRKKEIVRVAKARWESIADGKLLVNVTEGKVKINQNEFLFSDIQGAELNFQGTSRIKTDATGTSKRKASLGGAVLGGMVFGGAGAVIGGVGLGKTKNKSETVQTEIPMCTHIGVLVNLNGFITEIVLLTKQVEQSDSDCVEAQRDAQNIIAQLSMVAKMPVPTDPLSVEEEPSVKEYDSKIANKDVEIQVAIEDKPVFKIPGMYRTAEQKDMSDAEYLSYLDSIETVEDKVVERSNSSTKKEKVERSNPSTKKEKVVKVRAPKKEKVERSKFPVKKVAYIIGNIVGWVISIFMGVLVLAAIIQKGVVSGFMFIGSALSVNPVFYKFLKSKLDFLHKWMVIVLFVVTFIIGIVAFPTSTPAATAQVFM